MSFLSRSRRTLVVSLVTVALSVFVLAQAPAPPTRVVVNAPMPNARYVRAGAAGTGTGVDWTNAYTALPGTLVRGITYYIADGSYAGVTVSTAVSGTSRITFRKATAADHGTNTGWNTTFGNGVAVFPTLTYQNTKYIDTYGVTVSGTLQVASLPYGDPASTAFMEFHDMTARNLFIIAEDIEILGGSLGGFDPCLAGSPEDIVSLWDNSSDRASSRITFDGVTIHDSTDHGNLCAGYPNAGFHADCVQILGGHNLTFRNSVFYNCPTSAIIAQGYRDTFDGVTIENNWFQSVQSPGATINFGGGDGYIGGTNVVRYNTILGFSSFNLQLATGGSLLITGNVLSVGVCGYGTYSYNLHVAGTTCGTNERSGSPSLVFSPSPSYLNGLTPNYHLNPADTAAKDQGNASSYPARDIDGERRYQGIAPDIGADEMSASLDARIRGGR